MKGLEDILDKYPFTKGFKPEHLHILAGCASNLVVKKGEYLGREGGHADKLFILREGRIALDINAENKGIITVQTIDPGEVVGWSWMVEPFRWHFDLRVVEDSRLIAFDGDCLRKKCTTDMELGYLFLDRIVNILEKRLNATRIQILDMYGKN